MKVVDLFSGIGGFRHAINRVKIPNLRPQFVAASDIDPVCKNFYQASFPHVAGEEFIDDVQSIWTPGHAGYGSKRLPPFDLLTAGFPCQPFANIGQRGGLGDERGALIFEIIRILEFYRPPFFVLENVQKLRNLHRGSTLRSIESYLSESGYHVHVWDLCASDYGVPQQRRRLFFCGVDSNAFKVKPKLDNPPIVRATEFRTTWNLLEREMRSEHLVPHKTRETVLRKNPKWQGDLDIDRRIARPVTASMAKWHRANQDNYFSETYVLGDFGDPSKLPKYDLQKEPIRRISPLEGFRLQGFPENAEKLRTRLGIKFTPAYRIIGNAVPVPLAKSVIEHFLQSYDV